MRWNSYKWPLCQRSAIVNVLCTWKCEVDPKFAGHRHATVSCQVICGSPACTLFVGLGPTRQVDCQWHPQAYSNSFGEYKFLPGFGYFWFSDPVLLSLTSAMHQKHTERKERNDKEEGTEADKRERQEIAAWYFWMCRVKENLLTQTANTIVNALQLNCRVKQGLFLILGCLKLGGLAIKRSAMKKFINAISQIKVNFSLASVLPAWIYPYIPLPLWGDYCNWSK